MKLIPFEMERYQSLWENNVEYNLSESGVHPLKFEEFVSAERMPEILASPLGYNQTNGTEELRSLIADMYPSAESKNVLVTTGSSEANFLATLKLLEIGDEIAFLMPNYMQIWGIANSLGAIVKPFHLQPINNRWQIDWNEFECAVSSKTKLIAICHPNNPTGAQLRDDEIGKICRTAEKHDAWILSDEVYRGAEHIGATSQTFWGKYEKVIVSCGLSKAYGLPGLRIGWLLGPEKMVEELWSYKDYTTICPSPISDKLARIALQPAIREKIIHRTRTLIRTNFTVLKNWMESHDNIFENIPPTAGAITILKHHFPFSSEEFVVKLRDKKSVLIVPGEQFQMNNCLRIGFGSPQDYLQSALDRVSEFIRASFS